MPVELEETTNKFWDFVGGRKFTLSVLTQALISVLLFYGKLDVSAYSTITIAVVGAYIAGNVVQKVKS
jgi:hypothetical protein